jgi:DnaJ-class molecular chaperone
MQHEPYQDLHPEVPCPACEGAGFFGNGPYVEFCAYCHGTGVMIDESVTLTGVERKPLGRERRKAPRRPKISGGDPDPF